MIARFAFAGKPVSYTHLNINLVTPGQWRPWITAALDLARAQGLHLPIVCNTGGYETVENVKALSLIHIL